MTKTQAVEYFGTAAALARALGIAPAAVSQWEEVPEGRQWQLEVITGGRLVADREEQPAA